MVVTCVWRLYSRVHAKEIGGHLTCVAVEELSTFESCNQGDFVQQKQTGSRKVSIIMGRFHKELGL